MINKPFLGFIQKLWRLLQSPPPWFWGAQGAVWQRFGEKGQRLPLELLQQLHWWLIVPWRRARYRIDLNSSLPVGLRLRACWLNSYQPRELAWWWAAGVDDWDKLSAHPPESLTGQVHRHRRQHWPAECRPALDLLSDKAALLELTPPCWRAAFLKLEYPTSDLTPRWWRKALHSEGVVLKPLHGNAGRGVVRFRWGEQGLTQEGLFCQIPQATPAWSAAHSADPAALHQHWQRMMGSQEAVLASPYLSHSSRLPEAHPSVVVRVLTQQPAPGHSIHVALAWVEIPLSDGGILFLGLDGQCLPKPRNGDCAEQHRVRQQWQQQLMGCGRTLIQACLDSATAMHALLPPIDQVAWDWIPAEPAPLLLEGNGGFGLLVPQLFQHLQKSINKS